MLNIFERLLADRAETSVTLSRNGGMTKALTKTSSAALLPQPRWTGAVKRREIFRPPHYPIQRDWVLGHIFLELREKEYHT